MSVTNEEISGTQSITSGGTTPTPIVPIVPTTAPISNGPSAGSTSAGTSSDDVVKSGYLRKLKGKKKFFVLRKETDADKPARLEYYASEKKLRLGHPPKKTIILKTCFNISGPDAHLKSKYSVSLHTRNDCVRISMTNEEEMNEWLRAMKALAGDEEDDPVEGMPKPHFEHVWMVHALNKGLGSKANIIGPYRLCLTSKELTLLKVGEHEVKFPLNVIRNVSHDATFGCFFHIELGRFASTGPGQLSLKTDDNNIAQNMHYLILKAMQNYSKEDIIPPRERVRTYTWTSEPGGMRPSHSTPPGIINGLSSIDEPTRIRTDSSASAGRIGMSQMSPPVPIHTPTPSFVNSPNMYSTGTDSASSSYSMDYDNNNHSHGSIIHPDSYPKSNDEDESYVPYYPNRDDQHISPKSLGSLKLPLNPDMSDYVDTSIVSKDSTSSNAQTPSSYMEMQSPTSPFDNYMPMSPAAGTSAINPVSSSAVKSSNGKVSVSHSRNSSLVEDNDGYVPMIPGGHHSRSESGAGSTAGSATGLDGEAYLDMDFTRKMNLSNDDVRRMSPASSESLQSNTPSSDFPLEKVTSYLTDDFDESMSSMRPMRAYSVGSRSDTSSVNKMRSGKNRLEAVQESRTRAMSLGSKNQRKPGHAVTMNNSSIGGPSGSSSRSSAVGSVGPLSSSWSGSTGRWLPSKFQANHHYSNQNQHYSPSSTHSTHASESADSDLMELDFSKNKSKRKRSFPGPGPVSMTSTTPSSVGSASIHKLSPAPKGCLASSFTSEVSPASESSDNNIMLKSSSVSESQQESAANRNYVASAPISIRGCNRSIDPSYTFLDTAGGRPSILTQLTGLQNPKDIEDEEGYLDMDFTSSGKKSLNSDIPIGSPIIRPNDSSSNPVTSPKFYLNLSSPATAASTNSPIKDTTETSSKPPPYATCNGESSSTIISNSNSNPSSYMTNTSSSSKSNTTTTSSNCGSENVVTSTSSGLTRIEESPEKQDHSKTSSGSVTPQSPSKNLPLKPLLDDNQITYAAIEHLPPIGKSSIFANNVASTSNQCSTAKGSTAAVTYAQIDFVKSAETLKPSS